jgi:hypothetical protein
VTDTVSPTTEPHLTPMFATGAQPAMSPTTEPHHAPIFDTGPHPVPLRPLGQDPEPAVAWSSVEPEVEPEVEVEVESAVEAEPELLIADPEPSIQAQSTVEADSSVEVDVAPEAVLESEPEIASGMVTNPETPQAFSALDNVDTDAFLRSVTGHMPAVVPAQPVVVPGAFQFVKRWKFALITAGVWLLAATAGLGFYFWWYTALSKTAPVFGILLFLVVCMVASMLVSMVPNRPQVSALAIALMAAPLASMAAAAVLHGAYYFEWIARPVIG